MNTWGLPPLPQPARPTLAAVAAALDDVGVWRAYVAALTHRAPPAAHATALQSVASRLIDAGLWSASAPVDLAALGTAHDLLAVASLGVAQVETVHALAAACALAAVLPSDRRAPRPVQWELARGADDAVEWWRKGPELPRTVGERTLAEMGFGLRIFLSEEGTWAAVVQPEVDARALPQLLAMVLEEESMS